MKNDERRSHRLNYLLKLYLQSNKKNLIYHRAKQMGVTDSTAKDYLRTVIIQAEKNILEMEDDLQGKFRETRQNSVTAELLDIISAFESIKPS